MILNMVAWIALMILFSLLRQQAWDYGRLALVQGDKTGWAQLFYAQGSDEVQITEANSPLAQPGPSRRRQQKALSDRGFFSWIPATLRLTDDQILKHSGPDALHYLSFQRHLMLVMSIITFVSIFLILPINFHGHLVGDRSSFAHTTISNLAPNSPLLWIHTICAITFVPLVVLVMRRSSGRYAGKVAPTRTIMITNIGSADCNTAAVRNYIKELFPELGIEDVQMAYNISKLFGVAKDYDRVVAARIYCEIQKNRGTTVKVNPSCCSFRSIDALEYYRDREFQLCGEVARLKAAALNDPLGISFVTFTTTEAAQQVVHHFRPGTSQEWDISFAPSADDIFWENLSEGNSQWYLKWAVVNVGLFMFLFFMTTPVLIVNLLNSWSVIQDTKTISPLISEFLPTLLLVTLTVAMPVIVSMSDKMLSHWTRSRQNYSIMTKSFGYLMFMILILPSLGLTSAQALLDWTFHYKDQDYRWECVFLPDRGAFFVNYIITTAFIGLSFELIRVPDLLFYMFMLCLAKSQAETPYIRKSILDIFPFGVHYGWMLLVFSMSVVYSLACPLIMPFAMMYICIKYFNDRHNLYFSYKYSNMISQGGGKIHSTAVTLAKYSVVMLLLVMAALATLRSQTFDARSVVLIMSLVITLLMFFFMSPIKRCTMRPPRIIETDQKAPLYVPEVLLIKKSCAGNLMQSSPANYGSQRARNEHVVNVEPRRH